jgi:mRNA interferase RelE/StbE
MYRLELSGEAQRVYKATDAPLARKLAKCFARIEENPRRGNNIKYLKGPLAGFLRYRVGDFRVVYSIDEPKKLVRVVTIAHRRDVYE